jgi:hypothetical protein
MHRGRLAGFIIDCETTDLEAAADFWSNALICLAVHRITQKTLVILDSSRTPETCTLKRSRLIILVLLLRGASDPALAAANSARGQEYCYLCLPNILSRAPLPGRLLSDQSHIRPPRTCLSSWMR